jgi:hypothetical protein
MSEVNQVVLVGHCGFDAGNIAAAVAAALPEVSIESANDSASVGRYARPGSLLLVNRQLDGDFAGSDGVELIRNLAVAPDPPRMMLVSNYDDAQSAASDAGALPGFGKDDLQGDLPAQRLREATA